MTNYCRNCRNRKTCTQPCAPVEALLNQCNTQMGNSGRIPDDFAEQMRLNRGWPAREKWAHKTKKEKIIELYFVDHRPQHEIVRMVGTGRRYVSRIICAHRNKT